MDYKKEDLDNNQFIIIKYNYFISLAQSFDSFAYFFYFMCAEYIYLIFIVAKN